MSSSKLQLEHWEVAKDGELTASSMRRKLEAQGYRCTEYTFCPGTDFPDHSHACSKKDAIVTGRFRFTMHGATVVLTPGDTIDVPRGVVHSAAVVGYADVVFLDATK